MVLIYIEAHTIQFYETKSCGTIGVLAFPLLLPIISKLYRAIGGENVQLYCQSRFVIMFSMMGETFSWAATTRAGNGCATGAAADSVPQLPLMQQEQLWKSPIRIGSLTEGSQGAGNAEQVLPVITRMVIKIWVFGYVFEVYSYYLPRQQKRKYSYFWLVLVALC